MILRSLGVESLKDGLVFGLLSDDSNKHPVQASGD